MALFPCDVGSHLYPGKSSSIYPAVAQGSRTSRRKLRLCQQHFTTMFSEILEWCMPAQLELEGDRHPRCAGCGERVHVMDGTFFATVYAAGEERSDWWAPIHDVCVGKCLTTWQLPALS